MCWRPDPIAQGQLAKTWFTKPATACEQPLKQIHKSLCIFIRVLTHALSLARAGANCQANSRRPQGCGRDATHLKGCRRDDIIWMCSHKLGVGRVQATSCSLSTCIFSLGDDGDINGAHLRHCCCWHLWRTLLPSQPTRPTLRTTAAARCVQLANASSALDARNSGQAVHLCCACGVLQVRATTSYPGGFGTSQFIDRLIAPGSNGE